MADVVVHDEVVVDHLRVDRGGRTVLSDITTTIPAGQVVGLLGPSGSGKSTLIRAIVGVQVVARGTVTVFGQPAGSAGLRGRVGYMTQSPSVYEDLTVAANVRYFAAVVGASRSDADRALQRVDLTAYRDTLVRHLSGGQRSRASLACVIVGEPDILVLDEPTVGLDPVLRRDLWALFHALADGGRCVLVSSHVMDEATRCDRLLLLHEGRILADASPDGLLTQAGAPDAESAFLALIDAAEVAANDVGPRRRPGGPFFRRGRQ
jgi:ABC-2 type transport system ATP-binding protein